MLLNTISFNVAGITFENEEGKDIQKEIKKILNEYKKNDYFEELYGGYTNAEIREMDLNVSQYEGYKFSAKIVGDEYNGEECFKIYFKTYSDNYVHIGYAPKNELNELVKWITKKDIEVKGSLEVVGGKYKYCEFYEEDYEEKERVSIKELTYGVEVTLNFYDNTSEEKIEKIEKLEKQDNEGISTYENADEVQKIVNKTETIVWVIIIGIGIFIFSKFFSFMNWLLN